MAACRKRWPRVGREVEDYHECGKHAWDWPLEVHYLDLGWVCPVSAPQSWLIKTWALCVGVGWGEVWCVWCVCVCVCVCVCARPNFQLVGLATKPEWLHWFDCLMWHLVSLTTSQTVKCLAQHSHWETDATDRLSLAPCLSSVCCWQIVPTLLSLLQSGYRRRQCFCHLGC